MGQAKFAKFALGVLVYNLAVVVWGAFVRASLSGDGCGAHWPLCNGQILPVFGETKRIVEFAHRTSSGLLLVLVAVLWIWALRAFAKGNPVRKAASFAMLFTLTEAALGAALVLFKWVALNPSEQRAVAMALHLVNTFLLIGALTLTALWARGARRLDLKGQGSVPWALGFGLFGVLVLGVSGAVTALGDTLYPVSNLMEGLRQDLSATANFLIKLRLLHPLIATSVGLYLTLTVGLVNYLRPSELLWRASRWIAALFVAQMALGFVSVLLMAPIWIQMVHLVLADLLWIAMIAATVTALGEGGRKVKLGEVASDVPSGNAPATASAVRADAEHVGGELPSRATLFTSGSSRTQGARPVNPTQVDHTPSSASLHSASLTPLPRGDVAGRSRIVRAKRGRGLRPALAGVVKDYILLTKPRVISLLLFTTLAAMFIAAHGRPGLGLLLAVAVGGYMAAGAANAINMVVERDLDEKMNRTSGRPIVTRHITATQGLVFYVFVYTLMLKRRTWQNIVIGGAAGAFPPLVGWAAVRGDLSPLAWWLFLIVFTWTPVHFWALALLIKDDYARAGVPMLPVVLGEKVTVLQIGLYAIATALVSAMPLLQRQLGPMYFVGAVLLNVMLIVRSLQLYRQPDRPRAVSLYKYSMAYLALLFLVMAVDRATSL